jgi:hypothetical protein
VVVVVAEKLGLEAVAALVAVRLKSLQLLGLVQRIKVTAVDLAQEPQITTPQVVVVVQVALVVIPLQITAVLAALVSLLL